MQKKSSSLKKNKKKTKKRISLKRLIFILLAVIIAFAFLVGGFYFSRRENPNFKQSITHSNSRPAFRNDGDLTISLSQKSMNISIDIEVARNDEERMRGLMDRLSLPENAGMLFIFPFEEPRSFWMKNTFISLDIIYISANYEIVSIQKYTQPKSTYSIPSEKPARYVLEVNAGFTDKYGIVPGDKIDFSY